MLPTLRVNPATYTPEHMAHGELTLVCEMVERGVKDFLGQDMVLPTGRQSRPRDFLMYQLRLLAAEWVFDAEDSGPWSFEWATTLAELDAAYMRAIMQPALIDLVRKYREFAAELQSEVRKKAPGMESRAPAPAKKPKARRRERTPEQLARRREWERKWYAALPPERKAKYAEARQEAKSRWVARRTKARQKAKIGQDAKRRIINGCKQDWSRERRKKGK